MEKRKNYVTLFVISVVFFVLSVLTLLIFAIVGNVSLKMLISGQLGHVVAGSTLLLYYIVAMLIGIPISFLALLFSALSIKSYNRAIRVLAIIMTVLSSIQLIIFAYFFVRIVVLKVL